MGELQDAYEAGGKELSVLEVTDFTLSIGDQLLEDGASTVVMMSINSDLLILCFPAEQFLARAPGELDFITELFVEKYGREPKADG